MKKIFSAAVLLMHVAAARADGLPWKDFGIRADLSYTSRPQNKVSLVGALCYDVVPEKNEHELVPYVGILWQPSKRYWISPRWGVDNRFASDGYQSALLLAVWQGLSFFDDRLTIFAKTEHSFGLDGYHYRGYYSADLRILELLTTQDAAAALKNLRLFLGGNSKEAMAKINPLAIDLGLQVYQPDLNAAVGPHVGFYRPKSFWRVELQYYLGFKDDLRGQAVRILLFFDL